MVWIYVLELENLSNEQLVELAQSKHEIAFNIMLKRHKGLVYYKARGYFHSGVEFDDILQEGSIGLYRAISDYTKGHNMSFMSFAEMCIKRNIINYLRGLNRLKHTFLNEYISFETSIGNHLDDLTYINILSNEDQKTPEQYLVQRDTLKQINSFLIEELTAYECEVLFLFVKNYSYEEISNLLGKNQKSIDNTLQRIKRKSRKFKERLYSEVLGGV